LDNHDKIISEVLRDKIIEKINDLMFHYHRDYEGFASDYCCEFCGSSAPYISGKVHHDADCDGVSLINQLNGLEDTK
jgi:hypothetical protein